MGKKGCIWAACNAVCMLEDQLPAKDQGYNEHSNYYHGKHKAKQRIWAHVIVSHLKRSERKWFYQFGNTLLWFVAMTLPILFYKKSAIYHQSGTYQCWCCRCEPWCQWEAESSPSQWMQLRHLGNSQPGWLSGSCGCGIGSTLAWVGLEALSCPENGNGNL